MSNELNDMIIRIKTYLELEKESGMEEYFFGVLPVKAEPARVGKSDLGSMAKELSACKNCDLHKTRHNVVFGSGNPKANLMFIGEAPGEDEDLQGLPFVGRAGQLLTKIIEAMGFKRQDVYIANILKCRPPNNRMPLPAEILACEDNLKAQIDTIKPRVICALGKFASQTLLKDTRTTISALRGKFQEYNGIKVMPTFHPAYLLRNPQDKILVWEDMKKIKKALQS